MAELQDIERPSIQPVLMSLCEPDEMASHAKCKYAILKHSSTGGQIIQKRYCTACGDLSVAGSDDSIFDIASRNSKLPKHGNSKKKSKKGAKNELGRRRIWYNNNSTSRLLE